MLANLKGIFSPEAVAASLKTLPVLKTTIMDSLFKQRPTHPLPMIGVSDLVSVAQTVPVVRRDGSPVTLLGETANTEFIAPLPVKVQVAVTASELNDLKVLMGNQAAISAWRARKVDQIRRAVRDTTEAMASVVASTGKLSWPVEVSGGRFETYEVDYGQLLSHTPASKFTADASVGDVYELLTAMEEKIQQAGVGGNVEFWAGKDVVKVLLKIAEGYNSTVSGSPITLKLEQGKMEVGGYAIHFMKEKYPSPYDETDWMDKLDPKALLACAVEQPGTIWYCAIDSISANNAAVPLHIVPVPRSDDSGITLIGQAKPLPARSSRASCKAIVVD